MKFIFSFLLIVFVFVVSGCASSEPVGVLYNSTANGVSANNKVFSEKTGKSCATSILGWVAIGDNSINDAKADGGITEVATVDNTAFNVLGVYGHYCTVVSGE